MIRLALVWLAARRSAHVVADTRGQVPNARWNFPYLRPATFRAENASQLGQYLCIPRGSRDERAWDGSNVGAPACRTKSRNSHPIGSNPVAPLVR